MYLGNSAPSSMMRSNLPGWLGGIRQGWSLLFHIQAVTIVYPSHYITTQCVIRVFLALQSGMCVSNIDLTTGQVADDHATRWCNRWPNSQFRANPLPVKKRLQGYVAPKGR